VGLLLLKIRWPDRTWKALDDRQSAFGKGAGYRHDWSCKKLIMRLIFLLPFVLTIAGASFAHAAAPSQDALAQSVADFSASACYGLVSGSIAVPDYDDPAWLTHIDKTVGDLGLKVGVDNLEQRLGKSGTALISGRPMQGSKPFDQGDIVLAFGGPEHDCRAILLAEPNVDITDAVSDQLSRAGWKAVPNMVATQKALESRGFVRRDSKGDPYLMLLMTNISPILETKMRLFTTTMRLPKSVQLPEGF